MRWDHAGNELAPVSTAKGDRGCFSKGSKLFRPPAQKSFPPDHLLLRSQQSSRQTSCSQNLKPKMPYRIVFAFPQLSQILPQDFVSALIIFIIIKIAVCSSSEGISKTCVVVCAWSVLLPSFLFSLSFLSSSFSRWVQFILLIFLAPDCGGGRSIPSCMLRGPEIKPEKSLLSHTMAN